MMEAAEAFAVMILLAPERSVVQVMHVKMLGRGAALIVFFV
jgi:hypothetical protein